MELADNLFSTVKPLRSDFDLRDGIAAILPDLLKDFALKLGHNAPTAMHRDVMAFVHKNRQ